MNKCDLLQTTHEQKKDILDKLYDIAYGKEPLENHKEFQIVRSYLEICYEDVVNPFSID